MEISELQNMVAEDAALRRRQRLQPVGGPGDKIFPPTYPGEGRNAPPRHVYERRRLNGRDVWCVLIDSVQSQANRLEECLLEAIRDGLPIPYVEVDFSNAQLDGITRITSLDAPHRVYDAIFRDSMLEEDKPFMESAVGQRLARASAEDASALLEISPTALLFGAWHSTGQGGGLGAKFARCLVSEIMGIDVPVEFTEQRQSPTAYLAQAGERIFTVEPVTSARRPSSRIDPLGASSKVKIYRSADDENDWTTDREKAAIDNDNPVLFSRKKGDKAGKPSIINHGNIKPSLQPLGVTCDYAEHTFVLSFAALRRLRFGESEKNMAGRSLLAALGLVALTEQDARGYALRSRCDLVCDRSPEKDKHSDKASDMAVAVEKLQSLTSDPEKDKCSDEACDGRTRLELVRPDGTTKNFEIDNKTARRLYKKAFEAAKTAKFNMPDKPLCLTPQPKLVEIVRKSQNLALSGEGGEEEEASGGE